MHLIGQRTSATSHMLTATDMTGDCVCDSHTLSFPQMIMTFTLVSVVYAVAVAKPGHGPCAPLAIGFTLFASAFVGGGLPAALRTSVPSPGIPCASHCLCCCHNSRSHAWVRPCQAVCVRVLRCRRHLQRGGVESCTRAGAVPGVRLLLGDRAGVHPRTANGRHRCSLPHHALVRLRRVGCPWLPCRH